jgi:hypothetical protein
LEHIGGNAGDFGLGGVVGKGVGGVQRVFAEFLAQLGLAFLDFGKTVAVCALQFCARQHKVADGVFVGLALLGVQGGCVDGFVLGVEALVGAQAGPELGHTGQGSGCRLRAALVYRPHC